MNIAIIGYGKMGQAIHKLAEQAGHTITHTLDTSDFSSEELKGADVAIEFTQPDAAVSNITKCFDAKVPVVVGTTGWYKEYELIADLASKRNGALFTATNFSIGVNILFHINKKLASIMNQFEEYDVAMNETHHIHKKDHPSGTAVTLATDLVNQLDRKKKYVGLLEGETEELSALDLRITSKRENEVPGFHSITYTSPIDEITISHNALNRKGFALGAIKAAEWLKGKKGVFTMNDLLNFE